MPLGFVYVIFCSWCICQATCAALYRANVGGANNGQITIWEKSEWVPYMNYSNATDLYHPLITTACGQYILIEMRYYESYPKPEKPPEWLVVDFLAKKIVGTIPPPDPCHYGHTGRNCTHDTVQWTCQDDEERLLRTANLESQEEPDTQPVWVVDQITLRTASFERCVLGGVRDEQGAPIYPVFSQGSGCDDLFQVGQTVLPLKNFTASFSQYANHTVTQGKSFGEHVEIFPYNNFMYQRPGQKIPQGFYLVWGECGTANCTQSVYRAPDAQALLDFRLDKVAPDVWKIKDDYGELIQINQLQSDGELLYLHVGDGDPRSEFHAHFMIFDPIKGAVVNDFIPTPGMNTIPDGSFGVVKTESLASSSGPSLRAADALLLV